MVRQFLVLFSIIWSVPVFAAGAPDVSELRAVPARQAPVVELSTVSGQPRELRDYSGVVTLVHFWASWCLPCHKEMPDLEALLGRYNEKQLRIMAIAADSHEAVNNYLQSHPAKLSVLIDQYGGALKAFAVKGLPTTIVVDSGGHIRYTAVGRVAWTDAKALGVIDTLISQN